MAVYLTQRWWQARTQQAGAANVGELVLVCMDSYDSEPSHTFKRFQDLQGKHTFVRLLIPCFHIFANSGDNFFAGLSFLDKHFAEKADRCRLNSQFSC